jgi:hypothetical protein
MSDAESKETSACEMGCCPRFDPEPWDGTEVTWEEKLFVRDRVRSFLHIPLNFGGVMKRNMERIEAAGVRDPADLLLTDENSLWGADVYLAVDGEIPGARHERISGDFFMKVFEGPYSHARKWCGEMHSVVEGQGRTVKKLYNWYTTCPRCAKLYGKNYVVLVAEV